MAKASSSYKRKKRNIENSSDIDSNNKIVVVENSTSNGKRRRRVPRDSPSQRSSIYRGVTKHRWTGRYEAHLWDKDCRIDTRKKKGRQVYLGAYDDEVAAAHAYDLAALKYWGKQTPLNFPFSTYEDEMKGMEGLSKEEYIGSLRRKSNGFSRGVSKYRGVARHHHNGRWEARIGRVFGHKYLYLGTYATQEEAATAYDKAAIEHRGLNAVTNFDISRYINFLQPKCHDQPNNVESTKSKDHNNDTLLGQNFGQIIYDQMGLDETIWPLTLLDLDHHDNDLLHNQVACIDSQGSSMGSHMHGSSDDIWNNDNDFFSDFNSFLCDFDMVEDEEKDH